MDELKNPIPKNKITAITVICDRTREYHFNYENIHTYEQKLGGIQGILAQGIFPQLFLNTDDSNIL